MPSDDGYCMYCEGKFVGHGETDEDAFQDVNQQLMRHEGMCLMRYKADKNNDHK